MNTSSLPFAFTPIMVSTSQIACAHSPAVNGARACAHAMPTHTWPRTASVANGSLLARNWRANGRVSMLYTSLRAPASVREDNKAAAAGRGDVSANPRTASSTDGPVDVVGVATGDCGTVDAADAASTAATTAAGGLESMKALWVAMARVHSCTEGARGSTRPTRQ